MDYNAIYNNNAFIQHPGYRDDGNGCLINLFSAENIKEMSREITHYLKGVHPSGRDIIIPDDQIYGVLSNVNQNYRPNLGDIYTRYNLEKAPIDDYAYIRAQALDILINTVRDSIGIEENNRKLTVWTSVLGTQNNHRLRSHDVIKIKKRRPAVMQFNMKY